MNNKYSSLFCIIVLALVPACKQSKKVTATEKVNTMIEIETSAYETKENSDSRKSINKF
jgi:hypothetical protein